MKTAPTGLVTLLGTGQFVFCDLYQFTLITGQVLRYTTADVDITYAGNTYSSALFFDQSGSKAVGHWKTGLDVDTWQVYVMPVEFDPVTLAPFPIKIGSTGWLAAVAAGALAGAQVDIHRAYWASWPQPWQSPLAAFSGGNDGFTKVLLHLDGSNGSTTITDENAGGSAHTWTAAGNAQIDTAQSKFGGASGLFDGTGDWVSTPDSTEFTLGSGDFTVDCWFNCTAAGGTTQRLCGQRVDAAAANTSFRIERNTSNVITAGVGVGAALPQVNGTTQFTDVLNTGWHHLAFVGVGGVLKLFIDGTQEGGNVSIGGSVNDVASALGVGAEGGLTTNSWTGWIDEFRLSIGVARWTANFTPPTEEYSGTFVIVDYFAGRVAAVDVMRNQAVVSVNSWLDQFQIMMPRNLWQAACRWTLFDAGCTLSQAAFTTFGAALVGTTQSQVVTIGFGAPAGYFALGQIVMTSGLNTGFRRMVKSFDGTTLFLIAPFPFTVAVGDTFQCFPGCSKTLAVCTNTFNNAVNFGGTDLVPRPETAV